jgi:hypothetical protein
MSKGAPVIAIDDARDLCTATQPALVETNDEATSFKRGFRDLREIAPDPERLYQTFKRAKVEGWASWTTRPRRTAA